MQNYGSVFIAIISAKALEVAGFQVEGRFTTDSPAREITKSRGPMVLLWAWL